MRTDTARNKKTKRMTGGERKAQIVRVASDLFAENGFRGTTTREIAKKAGISEAVIFKHFSKKEDLYNAIIDSRCLDTQGRSRLMGLLEGRTGREVFTEMAKYMLAEHEKDPSFMRLLSYSALERHGLSEMFIKTRGLELLGYLESQIKALVSEGVFKKTDPMLAARAFMGMVLHYTLAQELYGLKKFFKRPSGRVAETFVDIFFEGMRRRK